MINKSREKCNFKQNNKLKMLTKKIRISIIKTRETKDRKDMEYEKK